MFGLRNILKRNEYFAVITIESIEEGRALPEEVYLGIENYFAQRNKKIQYIEPYSYSQDYKTYMVIGTHLGYKHPIVQAFLLELYAYISNSSTYSISSDFPLITKIIEGKEIKFFKIPKEL